MSDLDLSSLEEILKPHIHLGASGLLPALHAVQRRYGWISEPLANGVARALGVPLADVHGVIEFYSLFYNQPIGKRMIRICTDLACALKGADDILDHLCAHHGIQPHQTTPDGSTTIESVPCLGLCEHAPTGLVDDQAETNINLAAGSYDLGTPGTNVAGTIRLLTKNCGNGVTSLNDYGDYAAFKKAISMSPEEVIAEIKASGLVGRGGAAFPTGIKWEGVRSAPGNLKYVVCNTDESEPGTFKDRILLLDDPHLNLEGILIAAYAAGAQKGVFYVRGEYPYILPVLENAIAEARSAGYLGENILGSGLSFDIDIRLGAGAYICGEETALFESIEGRRGFPRIKPPYPTTHGLFGMPTVINNVETLSNVPLIIQMGAEGYRKYGTKESPGPKLFCVSGDVRNPSLVEVPFGVTIREVLYEIAGGIRNGNGLQAVLVGGAAGSFTTPEQLDVRLTFEDMRAAGLTIGSGVLMAFDETRDLRDALSRLGHFFAHESCGKCYPCQIGTQRQAEILDRISAGQPLPGDTNRLRDVGWTMTDSSLCGLGQTAATAVLSAMKHWPELFREERDKNTNG